MVAADWGVGGGPVPGVPRREASADTPRRDPGGGHVGRRPAYALFGGTDFGAGFWDLIAGGPQRGGRQRRLIEHPTGPVWEANHVVAHLHPGRHVDLLPGPGRRGIVDPVDTADACRVRGHRAGFRFRVPQGCNRCLAHRGLLLVIISAIPGVTSLLLLYRGRFLTARITAAVAVTRCCGPGAQPSTPRPANLLTATLIRPGAGTVLLVQSLIWLYTIFQRNPAHPESRRDDARAT
nr:cytochrome d ubiquinol oxidase subunit II [Acidiferrimicrobium sp. IK]